MIGIRRSFLRDWQTTKRDVVSRILCNFCLLFRRCVFFKGIDMHRKVFNHLDHHFQHHHMEQAVIEIYSFKNECSKANVA